MRQLFAVIETAAIRADFGRVGVQHLPDEIRGLTKLVNRLDAAKDVKQRTPMMTDSTDANGLVTRRSLYGFDETVSRLTAMIEEKGAKVFAVIDHAGEAAGVGLFMHPTKVLVFGSPKAGTPLMVTAHTLAIDLPLKILVSEQEDGTVSMTCNTEEYLADRHGLARSNAAALSVGDTLIEALAQS